MCSASIRTNMRPCRCERMLMRHACPRAIAAVCSSPEQYLQVHHVVDDDRKLPLPTRIVSAKSVPRLNRVHGWVETCYQRAACLHHHIAIAILVREQIRVPEGVEDHEAQVMRVRELLVRLETERPFLRELTPLCVVVRLVHVPERAGKESARPLVGWLLLP